MKRIFFFIACFTLILTLVFFILPKSALAAVTVTQDPSYADIDSGTIEFTFTSDGNDFVKGEDYSVAFFKNNVASPDNDDCTQLNPKAEQVQWEKPSNDGKTLTAKFDIIGEFRKPQAWAYAVWADAGCINYKTDHIIPLSSNNFIIYPPGGTPSIGIPAIIPVENCSNYQRGTVHNFLIENAQPNTNYTVWLDGQSKNPPVQFTPEQILNNTTTYSLNVGTDIKETKVCMTVGNNTGCDYSTPISTEATAPTTCKLVTQSNQPGLSIPVPNEQQEPSAPPPPCSEEGKEIDAEGKLIKCTKVDTAIGPFSTDPAGFIKSIFSLLLGVSGGIAVILIIVSGYKFMASQGNPEQVQGAREMLTSAIVGLLFIIFSFVILQVIGVDILKIPGFSK